MSSLSDLQAGIRSGVLGSKQPDGLTAPDPAEVTQRFAVYRNNVLVSLAGALAQRFPVVVRLVGIAFAQATFGEFVRTNPPRSPLMMHYGAGFPEFLTTFPPAAGLPYLPDVARLELARGVAFHAADDVPVAAGALARLAGAAPETVRLTLHPSVTVIRSSHPVHTLWTLNQPWSQAPRCLDWQPEAALVARSGLVLITERLLRGDAAFVSGLVNGLTLAAAGAAGFKADEAFDPATVLARLMGSDLVTAAESL